MQVLGSNNSEGEGVKAMRKLKRGDTAVIFKPLCVRRKNGDIESFSGRIVKVVGVELKNCRCDIGIGKIVVIPSSHLKKVA